MLSLGTYPDVEVKEPQWRIPGGRMKMREAHVSYNRASRMAERRKMMQSWADYLDALSAGSDVVLIRRSA